MNRLPAEWEPQAAVMLTWPRADGDFAANYPAVADCFRRIVHAICRFEPVILSFHSEAQRRTVLQEQLSDIPAERLRTFSVPNNDVWARDHGPIGVRSETGTQLLKFGFDGWGGKYASENDNRVSLKLAAMGAFPHTLSPIDLVMEGGAIETDGAGTLLATRSSLLDPKRNPGQSQDGIETLLRDALGIQHFLWLAHGEIDGDDTDGHIDTLARFVNESTIVYQASGGPSDPNHAELTAMLEELKAMRRRDGGSFELIALPYPGDHRNEDNDPLPAGYANFLIINNAVLLPTYGVDADHLAAATLAPLFPGREIISVDCQALIRQYGSLHCVTMNIPA